MKEDNNKTSSQPLTKTDEDKKDNHNFELTEAQIQQVLDMAYSKKQEGDKYTKSGDIDKAYTLYTDSSKLISTLNKKQPLASTSKIITDIYIPANLNLSYIDIKKKNWDLAIKHCNKVLKRDNKNLKAQYRRCKAYIHAGQLKKADEELFDLEEPLGGTPELEELEELYALNHKKSEGFEGAFLKKMAKNIKGKNIYDKNKSVFDKLEKQETKEDGKLNKILLYIYNKICCCFSKRKNKEKQKEL